MSPSEYAPEHEPPEPETIEIPAGTHLHQLSVVAETWDEFDRLSITFNLRQWFVGADDRECDPATDGARLHQHLEHERSTGRIVIYPPAKDRPDLQTVLPIGPEDFND